MIVLIDNGHGYNTPGKRSPDGSVLEYKYTREIANKLVQELRQDGYDARLVTPELEDISLKERCRRVNEICDRFGYNNVILVSIHLNASGTSDEWRTANGFGVYVSNNASQSSKLCAELFADWAELEGLKVRKPKPDQKYWQQNLAICRDSKCPAILTENLFLDNKLDVEFLLSEEGKTKIVRIHYEALMNYIHPDWNKLTFVYDKKSLMFS